MIAGRPLRLLGLVIRVRLRHGNGSALFEGCWTIIPCSADGTSLLEHVDLLKVFLSKEIPGLVNEGQVDGGMDPT